MATTMRPRGTLRLRLLRSAPCVVRVSWSRDGVEVGARRVYDATAALRLPPGEWTVDVSDERAADDPTRLAPARLQVTIRDGWATDAEATLSAGAVARGMVRTAADGRSRYAAVQAVAADGRVFRTRADGRGAYVLAGLPADLALMLSARSRFDQSSPVLVTLAAGRNRDHRLLLDQPLLGASRPGGVDPVVGGAFQGLVVDPATEQPAYAAVVELRDARGTLLARTRSDRQGRFVVGGDLPPSSGLTVVVKTGPESVVVDRVRLRGLACGQGQLVDLGTVCVQHAPRVPRPARADLARGTAAALTLPSTRI